MVLTSKLQLVNYDFGHHIFNTSGINYQITSSHKANSKLKKPKPHFILLDYHHTTNNKTFSITTRFMILSLNISFKMFNIIWPTLLLHASYDWWRTTRHLKHFKFHNEPDFPPSLLPPPYMVWTLRNGD